MSDNRTIPGQPGHEATQAPTPAAVQARRDQSLGSVDLARSILRDHVNQSLHGSKTWKQSLSDAVAEVSQRPMRYLMGAVAAAAVSVPMVVGTSKTMLVESHLERTEKALSMALATSNVAADLPELRVYKEDRPDGGTNIFMSAIVEKERLAQDNSLTPVWSCTAHVSQDFRADMGRDGVIEKLKRYADLDEDKAMLLLDTAAVHECLSMSRLGIDFSKNGDSHVQAARSMLAAGEIEYDQFESVSSLVGDFVEAPPDEKLANDLRARLSRQVDTSAPLELLRDWEPARITRPAAERGG